MQNNGNLNSSQVFSFIKPFVGLFQARGIIGTPEIFAISTMPFLTTSFGPSGPSIVMAMLFPAFNTSNISREACVPPFL